MPQPRRSSKPPTPRGRTASERSKATDRTGRPIKGTERTNRGAAKAERPLRDVEKVKAARSRRNDAPGRDRRDDGPQPLELPKRKGWGSVARKGAAAMKAGTASGNPIDHDGKRAEKAPDRDDSKWVRDSSAAQPKRQKATKDATTGEAYGERPQGFVLPDEAIAELQKYTERKQVDRIARYLKDAARAYAAERWTDSRKSLRIVLAAAPEAPVVLELDGMLWYRTAKWQKAIVSLEAAHLATQSYDLYPALMDCYRALKKYKKVHELWLELKEASPGAEIVTEGRIIEAETLASENELHSAISLLEKSARVKAKVQTYHLRNWYVLADLYDRAGDTGKARRYFEQVATHDEEMGDVLSRISALD